MNFFEKEMRSMFQHNDIIHAPKFCGKVMLGKLDDDLRVKLEFVSTYVSGQFDALRMTLINRTDGVVDKSVFKFSDILGKYQRPGNSPLDYHMWEYNNTPEWYTPVTVSQKAAIADRVLEYVEMFLVQSQGFTSPTM